MESKYTPPFKAIHKRSLITGNIFPLNSKEEISKDEYPLTIDYVYRKDYKESIISFELKEHERSKSRTILNN